MSLPVYRILIEGEKYERMKNNIWSDRFVQGRMLYRRERIPIRIRYRGGHTREYPKRSYEVRAPGTVYHFNAEYDDPSLIRNALSFEFFNSIHVPSPKTRHCVLYINNKLAGVYLQIEGVQPSFFRRRNIPVKSIVYAVNDHADFTDKRTSGRSLFSGYRMIKGGETERAKLIRFISSIHDRNGDDLRNFLQGHLHIDNYLRWLCGAVMTGNYDGFNQNYTIFEHGSSRLYHMIPWDYEGTWGRNCYGKMVDSNLVKIHGYNKLTEKVLSYRTYRQHYKRLLISIMNDVFTVERQLPIVYRMHRNIADDVYRDPNQKWNMKDFEGEPETIRKYMENRRRNIANQLRTLDF